MTQSQVDSLTEDMKTENTVCSRKLRLCNTNLDGLKMNLDSIERGYETSLGFCRSGLDDTVAEISDLKLGLQQCIEGLEEITGR